MNNVYVTKCLKRSFFSAVLIGVVGCTTQGNEDRNFQPEPSTVDVPVENSSQIIGTNCRAEAIVGPAGTTKYKSVYFSILANGSEMVQNVAETDSPCP